MRLRVSFLCLCLSLSGCDKPETSITRENTVALEAAGARRGHAARDPVPGSPEALRVAFVMALASETRSDRERELADVAWNALEIDPSLAVEALQQLSPNSPEKIRLIKHQAMRLAEQNPEQALAWAATVGSEEEVAAAFGQIALELAETDPRRAADLLSESGIVGRDFDVAVVQVVQRWAAISPPDAAAWVSSFPPSAARQAAVGIIAGQWLPSDPPASFTWIDSLKDPEMRKETARAMEGVILQQPEEIRDAWLGHADPWIRNELEQQRGQAIKDVGDNIPAPTN